MTIKTAICLVFLCCLSSYKVSATCTTKLCSLLEQRQLLEDFYQNVPPRPELEEIKAQKRAPGMEFLGKRASYLRYQHPLVQKRAPGMEFLGKRSMDNSYEILPYDDNIF